MNTEKKNFYEIVKRKLRYIRNKIQKQGYYSVKYETIGTIDNLACGYTDFDIDDLRIELIEGKFDLINHYIKNVEQYFK